MASIEQINHFVNLKQLFMGYIYIDESVHPKEDFIIISVVYSSDDLSPKVAEQLEIHGLDPKETEFKSGFLYAGNPPLAQLRKSLKEIMQMTKLGLIVLPAHELGHIIFEALKGASLFIGHNNLESPLDIYVDEGMTKQNPEIENFIHELNFNDANIHLEQNSRIVHGIQIADLAAHSAAVQFKCDAGLIKKNVRIEGDPIYEEIDLGLELFALLRYCRFVNPGNKNVEAEQSIAANFSALPHGLYISPQCDEKLEAAALSSFGSVYLGCMH